ncbi:MAG TPA: TRAFs-binding domain-containing protein [Anaerolineales bacterium]|nr:TRAFs-binding domain-containing protein [Anaerolineales bacterium]
MGLKSLFGQKNNGTLVEQVGVPAAQKQITAKVQTLEIAAGAGKRSGSIRPQTRPHAFVIMPFGKKKGADGSLYDFNAIYTLLIKPTLEEAGFEPFRADEATTSGDILTDMFQELLLADLCLVDMSIDNANVFYELGIRHAFRKRGIIHIQAGRAYMPFDVFNVRTIPYHITAEGVPDPAYLEKDKAAIVRVARDTWASDADAIHSPVYNILTGLNEPERKALRTPLATGFWREYNEWKQRVTVAQRQKRVGDILLLTEEIKNPFIKEEAIGEAGKALKNLGLYELALDLYRKGLQINARNPEFRRQEAFHLNRLGRVDEAIVKIENILAETPNDGEAMSYLGRIYKEMWIGSWKWIEKREDRLKTAFESYHWLLKSIDTYLKAYRLDLNQSYPGINALTLSTILVELANRFEDPQNPDPEIKRIRHTLEDLRGSLIFSLESNITAETADYWTLASLAELKVLTAPTVKEVERSYRKALTASRQNIFFIQSSLDQLEMLKSLDMRSKFVEMGIRVLREEMRRMRKENRDTDAREPKTGKNKRAGYIFLFTGHGISRQKDGPFPSEQEQHVKTAIEKALATHRAGPKDLAITAGMKAGSELLFVECCVERGIPVHVYFPYTEAIYVRDFVSPAGEQWVERFYKMRNHPLVTEYYQPDHIGNPKNDDNVHERNNRWALYSSLARGVDKVRLIALWDGKSEPTDDLDAHLVKHMVDLMRETGGVVEQINPTKLSAP